MATTSLWAVRTRLDHVIDYVANTEKTTNPDYDALAGAIEYVGKDWKTEQKLFVSGLNCSPQTAYPKMKNALLKNKKKTKILAYHGYQSFAKGEVDAATAHAIGLQLADELWGERYDVVVATHLNTDCFHNHFVVCATSFVDGKRYNYNKAARRHMMAVSDRLCRENDLSVLPPVANPKAVSYAEWQARKEGKPTKREMIRADIDRAIGASRNRKEFLSLMQSWGYVFNFDRKYPTIKGMHSDRAFRLERLGEQYTPSEIWQRIEIETGDPIRAPPLPVAAPKTMRYKGSIQTLKHKSKVTGLRAVYYRYCYFLGVFPQQQNSNRRMHYLLHDDLIKLDRIGKQTLLLWKNQISTKADLISYQDEILAKQTLLQAERVSARKALRKETDPINQDEIKAQISELSASLQQNRSELALCKDIETRSETIIENMKIITKDAHAHQGKEVHQDESWRRRRGSDCPHEYERH